MSTKDVIVESTKNLLWLKGYEAMSPSDVINESGSGKGSLYHHFAGKEALAMAALIEIEEELCIKAQDILNGSGSPLERVKIFLNLKRSAIRGCRLGRMVNEQSVIDSNLSKPIESYFTKLSNMLEGVLLQAKEAGELACDVEVTPLSVLIMATIQGGFVISRGKKDPDAMKQAVTSLCRYLDCLSP